MIICHDCRREDPQRAVLPPKPCEQCGEVFTPKLKAKNREPQRFCSASCRSKWVNGQRTAHLTPEQKRERAAQKSKTNCRKRRLRLSAAGWDGVTDADILDRDKWICKMPVCLYGSRRISKTRKYPDPRSPGVDHIVPISLGGDDTAFNKRAAHHGCNMARGAGRPGEQMPLNFGLPADEVVLPRPRKPRKPPVRKPRPCRVCGELSVGRCGLHEPVWFVECKRCGAPVASQTDRRTITCAACRALSCAVPECSRARFTQEYCAPHYFRLKRHGDVFADIPIQGDGQAGGDRYDLSILAG